MLDLERNQLGPVVDLTVLCRRPYAGSERAETACGAKKEGERRLATRRVRVWARIRGHRLVTSDIRAFDTSLSSMKPHQVLFLVCMHAVCLSCLHVV